MPHPPLHQPSPVKYLITIQDGGIESLIYLAFRSKITAALQASVPLKKNNFNQSKAGPTNSKTNDTKAELNVYFFTKRLVVVNIMYAQKERIFSLGVRLFCNFHN